MNLSLTNVDVELLRWQQIKLLELENPGSEIEGLINLIDYMLDQAANAES